MQFFLGLSGCPEVGMNLTCRHLTYSKSASRLAPGNQAGRLSKGCGSGGKKVDRDWGRGHVVSPRTLRFILSMKDFEQ